MRLVISSNKDLWLSTVVKIPLQVGPICILLRVPNYGPECDLGWGLRATQTPKPSARFWLASHQQTTLQPAMGLPPVTQLSGSIQVRFGPGSLT